jgi:integrase
LSKDELKRIYNAASDPTNPFHSIVRLLILTGQRRTETARLKAEYISREARTITLPAEITKNGREHTFAYGDMTAGLLAKLPQEGYLFPASRSHVRGKETSTFNGWSKAKADLDALCGVSGWTLHDLRRTFSTNMAALGVPIHVTEKLLNHVSGSISGVAAIYNRHSYLPEMRDAVAKWEAYLSALTKKE